MKIASLTSISTSATKIGRRISFIRNASAVSHTGATPQNGIAARRFYRHDA
jgi:hypothetical protein